MSNYFSLVNFYLGFSSAARLYIDGRFLVQARIDIKQNLIQAKRY